jgi:phospholipid/cholesterol/gamma-HCH transport system substrate-binding protein
MASRPARDLTVGVVAALGLAILAAATMAVGGNARLLGGRASYRVVFPNTVGLVEGSPVLMAGVQIGVVTDIQLPTDPGEPGILVRMGIESKYTGRVRGDSQAALRISQYLSGEKYIEITPGDPGQEVLAEGALIPLKEESGVIEQGMDIAENLEDITISLRQILGPLERGEGVLGEMLQNPDFGREGLESLGGAVENLEDLTGRIRRGQGFVGRAMVDPAFAARIDDLSRAIEGFAGIATCLGPAEGSLCEILAKDGDLQAAIAELRQGAASLRSLTDKLDSTEGLLGKLLNDPAWSGKLSGDLEGMLADLAEIAAKVNEGEGTLGALVNDRVLYDGAEEVVAGVNDSKFARWLLRHYRKKGVQALGQEEAPAEEEEGGNQR